MTDHDVIRQPLALISDGIDSLPFSASDFDLGDISDSASDVVATIASGGTKVAYRSVRTIVRHRRGVAYGLLALALVALGVALAKKRQDSTK